MSTLLLFKLQRHFLQQLRRSQHLFLLLHQKVTDFYTKWNTQYYSYMKTFFFFFVFWPKTASLSSDFPSQFIPPPSKKLEGHIASSIRPFVEISIARALSAVYISKHCNADEMFFELMPKPWLQLIYFQETYDIVKNIKQTLMFHWFSFNCDLFPQKKNIAILCTYYP